MHIQYSNLLKDPSARVLVAGDLEAVFLPGHGMLGASLRHRSLEMLRRVEDLDGAAANGSTAVSRSYTHGRTGLAQHGIVPPGKR